MLDAGQYSYWCRTEHLQTSFNIGRLCPAWPQAETRERQHALLWHGKDEEFEQSVAVGGHSELMPLPLLLLQHSFGLLQRFTPCRATACVNPCPEAFAVSVVTGPSRRVWEAEEGKKEGRGRREEATALHTGSALAEQLKTKTKKKPRKKKSKKEKNTAHFIEVVLPSING